MRRITGSFFVFLFILTMGYAQEKRKQKADRKYENMEYAYAAYIYEKVVEAGYASEEIHRKLGDAYYFQSQLDRAAVHYENYLEMQPDPIPEYYFRYAVSLKSVERYQEAEQLMEKFMADAYKDLRAQKFSAHRNYLEEISKQSGRYRIDTLEFNSARADFAPRVLENILVFASSRDRGLPKTSVDRWSAHPFFDLYTVDTTELSNRGETGFKLRGLVNTRLHESTAGFSPDGRYMYFTTSNAILNDPVKDSSGITRLRIKRARRDDKNRWGDIEDLSINDDQFSTAHPALSADGRTMFFVSDRPGGFGASDIWKVSIDAEGNTGIPHNLGDLINTAGRESFPFVNENSELFFAADSHPGLGGLDVFVSQLNAKGDPIDVYNLGTPVNTPYDDFGYMESITNKRGYFASNRPGGKGSDDIYRFVQTAPIRRACIAPFEVLVQGPEGIPLSEVAWKLINEKGEMMTGGRSEEDGRFTLEYDCDRVSFVRVQKEGYAPQEVYLNDKTAYTFLLETDRIELTPGIDLSQVLNVSPVYFEFDKYEISSQAAADLQKIVEIMNEYPDLRLEVRAYTDSRGEESYNQLLSEKRAAATVNYLVNAGISSARLKAVGYGESMPLNDCGKETPCSKEDHAENRRSAFVITN